MEFERRERDRAAEIMSKCGGLAIWRTPVPAGNEVGQHSRNDIDFFGCEIAMHTDTLECLSRRFISPEKSCQFEQFVDARRFEHRLWWGRRLVGFQELMQLAPRVEIGVALEGVPLLQRPGDSHSSNRAQDREMAG